MNFLWPVQGNITSGYGNRTILGVTSFHNGIDIGAPNKSSVVAAADGKITYSGFDPTGGGNIIIISHAGGYVSEYMHLSHFAQSGGAQVKAGQQIALSGGVLNEIGAGNSSGAHLHFEIKLNGKNIDPMSVLSSGGATASDNNGATARYPQGDALGNVPALANGKGINLNPLNLLGLGGIASFLTTSSNWKRIGLGAIGATILLIAAIELGSTSGAAQTIAKVIP